MRTLTVAVLSGLGLLAAPFAFADDAKPMAPTPVSTTASEPLICHAMAHEGSVVHRSECRTQKEWDRVRFQSQESLREWQQRNLTH